MVMAGQSSGSDYSGYAWLAAVVPAAAHRFRTTDPVLAAALLDAGAELAEDSPDVEIVRPEEITGEAAMAIVDIGGLSINRGGIIRRLGGRIASSLTSRLLASRARRIVRRCGYETVAVIPWEVSHTFRRTRFAAGARRASLMELLPLRALVVGQRRRSEPTLLDAAIAEAGTASGLELRGAHETPRHGVFVVKSREAVLRVAVGPGSRQIKNQFEALEALRGADVPPYVADRVPWVLARGRSGLAAWSLERRLPGSTTRPTLDQGVLDDCVEFLVALQSISHDTSHTALCAEAAEIVTAACDEGDAELVRSLAHRLDCDLEGVPRGFAHGDFFRGNLLVADRRLVGVVDWDAGGAGRLPLLDLLHLRLWSEHRPQDEDWGLVLVQHLLPWADAGGDDLARGYCRRIGLDHHPARLRNLVLAYWLVQLAYQLSAHPYRWHQPRWLERNIRLVLRHVAPQASS